MKIKPFIKPERNRFAETIFTPFLKLSTPFCLSATILLNFPFPPSLTPKERFEILILLKANLLSVASHILSRNGDAANYAHRRYLKNIHLLNKPKL
jgi:hypothetical protein